MRFTLGRQPPCSGNEGVKGYRSALNSAFALKGMDLADSHPISMLIRSFSKSVRPEELRPPAWDVAVVLQSLTSAPYEPLRTSDERFLAQKKLFLLALASAKQIGELTPFRILCLTPGTGVRCPSPSLQVLWRRRWTPPPLLLGLRDSLYRPYQT